MQIAGELNEGVVIQEAVPIASISYAKGQNAVIEVRVSAADRSRIKVGNSVNIKVGGLQQNVYGTLMGKVI